MLKNNSRENRFENLLCFGYSCRLFRDDQKALHIDQGKHLIQIGGSLKIDRYDVRATLPDLVHFEPPPGGYVNRLDYLSPAEQKAEQLCEEERYYSLYHNEDEEMMYQEEELKRIHQERSSSYGQVEFDYDKESTSSTTKDDANVEKSEEPDEIFIPPKNLEIPVSIDLPDTMKLHAIIEKTAKFISMQGPQMEILIKAKQSNNPQFEFLNTNNRLNPYYKYILTLFKNGTYPTEENNIETNSESQTNSTQVKHEENFEMNRRFDKPVLIPTIKYKPSASCAYTQLISKIKGVPLPPSDSESEQEDQKPSKSDIQQNAQQFVSFSYPSSVQYHHPKVVDKQSISTQLDKQAKSPELSKLKIEKTDVEIKKISTGLMLAQCYASDTDCEDDDEPEKQSESEQIPPVLNFPIPPEQLQHIIDKTAVYVAKNGKQFEEILRTKQDSRFLFLDPGSEFHPYYCYKVTGVVQPYVNSKQAVTEATLDKSKIITPVCFSIKTKDDTPTTVIRPVLPQEASDDEVDTQDSQITNSPSTTIPLPDQPQNTAYSTQPNDGLDNSRIAQNNNSIGLSNSIAGSAKSRFDIDNTGTRVNSLISSTPVSLESLHQKELKRAEEKVKDRLAQIAREKLGLISKEKQLQLERKKKAQAFLNQIKSTPAIIVPSFTLSDSADTQKITTIVDSDSESDTSSIHSIPISSKDGKSESIEKDVIVISDKKSRTRSRTRSRSKSKSTLRSSSQSHKKKKKSKHHSKKKSKKRSRSRSRSHSSDNDDRKRQKRSGSKKVKSRRRDD